MSLLSAIRVALAALLVHKGRSALTSLGIVIGIAAVIALVSAGGGARRMLDDRLDNVGKNLIVVRAGAYTQAGALADLRPLTGDDANVLRRRAGHLLAGVAEVQLSQRVASTRTHAWRTLLVGTTPDMWAVRRWQIDRGRFFDLDDMKKQAAVCLLGQTVAEKLFPGGANPVGRMIRVDRVHLRVLGVLQPKGRSPIGGDQDDQVFVPLTTMQRRLVGEERVSLILTAARHPDHVERAREEVARVLRQTHRVKTGSEDFDVSSVQEMAELGVVLTQTMQLLVGVIASVSLLVGGIGIMNIMLVSVTERTHEIGIRMAVGATAFEVLRQFLIEAVVLSLLGGLLGIVLGLAGAVALAWLAGWPMVLDPFMVLLAFGVSAAVGVFFGYYPALKASRLDPIEALRYE